MAHFKMWRGRSKKLRGKGKEKPRIACSSGVMMWW
jgi:hypothetical protein